jgi:hypothetical protein
LLPDAAADCGGDVSFTHEKTVLPGATDEAIHCRGVVNIK